MPSHRDRIRVAYLSPDFRQHAVSNLTVELFEVHDRTAVEVIGVSFGADDGSALRQRVATACDRFIDVTGRSDTEITALLREMEIDIAVDLCGHTLNARTAVFAHRPAPIQVNYLGFPGPLGAPFIDYLLADAFLVPSEDQTHYVEQVVYLPDCYQVNDRQRVPAAQLPSRSAAGLPDHGFVFCCFNNSFKITPDVFELWMRLLHAVEGSVIWLLGGNAEVENNLRREAAARGVAPERLVFAPLAAQADHLARHVHADLFLDTAPYNAHTTASDALWMGVPVLTRMGGSFPSRVAASVLSAAGLPELITTSMADYRARALALARDPAALAALKAKIVDTRSAMPLFDTAAFTRHVEAAYTTMWQRVQRGEAPAGFAVAP
jgi:predicted O-linked N-acetylglucosamine transferase (SPINDLY family)